MALNLPNNRIPVERADLSALSDDQAAACVAAYAFPDGTIDQAMIDAWADDLARKSGPDTSALEAAAAERGRLVAELAEVETTFREQIRYAYRDGVPASRLAEIVGLSLARVQQLVAGARR